LEFGTHLFPSYVAEIFTSPKLLGQPIRVLVVKVIDVLLTPIAVTGLYQLYASLAACVAISSTLSLRHSS
jgi:hypothetical protein